MVVPTVVCHHGVVMAGPRGSVTWCGFWSGSLGWMVLGGLSESLVLVVVR